MCAGFSCTAATRDSSWEGSIWYLFTLYVVTIGHWAFWLVLRSIVSHENWNFYYWIFELGMARGIPRSSKSRTFFHSSIPRGIDFITPRLLESSPKFTKDLENTEFPFLALKYEKKEKIFRNLSRLFSFYFCFSGLPINFWYYYLTFWTLKYKFRAEIFFWFLFSRSF